MKFVRLTSLDGEWVYVNPDAVTAVVPYEDHSEIKLTHQWVVVKEPPAMVVGFLEDD